MAVDIMKAGELKPDEVKDYCGLSTAIFERKYDGSRFLCINGALISDRNIQRNDRFDKIDDAVQPLKSIKDLCILDGEIFVEGGTVLNLNASVNWDKARYCVFDVLYWKGKDMRTTKLLERKMLLTSIMEQYFKGSDIVFMPETWLDFDVAWKDVNKRKLEGVMIKDMYGLYYSGKRSNVWLKVKARKNEDMDILAHESMTDKQFDEYSKDFNLTVDEIRKVKSQINKVTLNKGAFVIRTPDGIMARTSAKSIDIKNEWLKHKYKKAEVSFLFKTDDGIPFQPVLEKFIE